MLFKWSPYSSVTTRQAFYERLRVGWTYCGNTEHNKACLNCRNPLPHYTNTINIIWMSRQVSGKHYIIKLYTPAYIIHKPTYSRYIYYSLRCVCAPTTTLNTVSMLKLCCVRVFPHIRFCNWCFMHHIFFSQRVLNCGLGWCRWICSLCLVHFTSKSRTQQ